MTETKSTSAEPQTDKSEYSSEYPDPKNASSMSTVDRIEWIAQIAYDGKDWGWLKAELMRRFERIRTCRQCAEGVPLEDGYHIKSTVGPNYNIDSKTLCLAHRRGEKPQL